MAEDNAVMQEGAHVGMGADVHDRQFWKCHTKLEKFNGDSTNTEDLYEMIEVDGNLLVTGGSSIQWQTLIGNGTATAGQALTFFNTANAAIGVGDNGGATTANEAVAQTDLVATANKLRKVVDSGFPAHTDSASTASANTITFRATFATTEANYVWNEWGLFNSASAQSGGRMLNRKVQALGTKASGTTWQITVTLTLS